MSLHANQCPSPLSRRDVVVLATATIAVLAIAAWIRFHNLGAYSFTQDEPAVVLYVLGRLPDFSLTVSPLSPWATHLGFCLFGVNEFAARFFSAVAGVASLIAFCIIGHRFATIRGAFVAAALIGLSFYHIYFSQTARYPIFEVLFGFALLACVVNVASQPTLSIWALIPALPFVVLGVLSHLFFAKLVFSLGVGIICAYAPSTIRRARMVGVVVCGLLTVLMVGTTAFPSFGERLHFQGPSFVYNLGRIVLWESPALWLIGLTSLLLKARSRFEYILKWSTVVALMWLCIFCLFSNYRARYAAWIYPLLATDALVVTCALSSRRLPVYASVVVATCVGIAELPGLTRYKLNNHLRSPIKNAIAIVAGEPHGGEVFLASGIGWWAARVYCDDGQVIPIEESKEFFSGQINPRGAWTLWHTLGEGAPAQRDGYEYEVVDSWKSGTPWISFNYMLLHYRLRQ